MWKNIDESKPGRGHYSIMRRGDGVDALEALRQIFPEGEANDLNFVLFSTSGVHGSYLTIEDAERNLNGENEDVSTDVTFLVVHPRLVSLRYGVCYPQTQEDIDYLKKLRATSLKSISEIGLPANAAV